jgi:hypothetical protein
MVLKEMVINEKKSFSFLSKTTAFDLNGRYVLKRFVNRLVASGNQSFKNIIPSELDHNIRNQLLSCLHDDDVLTNFVKTYIPDV